MRSVDAAVTDPGAWLRLPVANGVLNAQEREVMRLALAPSTQQFVASRENASGQVTSSRLSSNSKSSSESSNNVPVEVSSSMRLILDRRGVLASLAIFNRNNERLLFAERGKHLEEGSEDSSVRFDTSAFPRTQPKPDDRVYVRDCYRNQSQWLLPAPVCNNGANLSATKDQPGGWLEAELGPCSLR